MAWGTDLKRNIFWKTRIKLAFLVLAPLVAASVVVVQITEYSYSLQHVKKDIAIVLSDAGINTATQQTRDAINEIASITDPADRVSFMGIAANAAVILLATIAGYFGIKRIITPISEVVDQQKRFIDDASHELRTPLSIMKTSSEVALMRANNLTKDELKNVIKENVAEVDRMSETIKNLFYLSRAKLAGGYSPNEVRFQVVRLPEVISAVAASLQKLASIKKIKLEHAAGTQKLPLVWGNKLLLEEAIANVVKNSIFYTPPGGSVVIGAATLGNPGDRKRNVELSVRDTGIGIPKEDIPFIFQPFYRSRATQHVGGSGIGLTIVKQIIAQHRGHIRIESAVNRGTTVKIILPAYRQEAPQSHKEI